MDNNRNYAGQSSGQNNGSGQISDNNSVLAQASVSSTTNLNNYPNNDQLVSQINHQVQQTVQQSSGGQVGATGGSSGTSSLQPSEPVVFFRGVTWLRDSHGLFDYESRNIQKMNLKTQSCGKIVRNNDNIEFMKPNNREEDLQAYGTNSKTIACLKQDSSGYYLDHAPETVDQEEESTDRLWLVARSLKNQQGKYDYKINKFDAIKLGRVRFRVKDFKCEQMNLTPQELYDQEFKEAQSVKTSHDFKENPSENESLQCRFCWCHEETADNPLILACKCRGSVGLIHFFCLKAWIQTQKHTKEFVENVTSFYWKKFECEICKTSYPYIFKSGEKIFKLIDIELKKDKNYILLESMPLDKNTSRNIHLLTVSESKSQFKLGRGHESEVRINDISVSRCHAIIKCKTDGFYIEDNQSKFGTIILLKDKLRLKQDHTMAIQVGRTVVSFCIKSIPVDKLGRERLKKECRPLLQNNRDQKSSDYNKDKSIHNRQFGQVNKLPSIANTILNQGSNPEQATMVGFNNPGNGNFNIDSENLPQSSSGQGPHLYQHQATADQDMLTPLLAKNNSSQQQQQQIGAGNSQPQQTNNNINNQQNQNQNSQGENDQDMDMN